MAEEVNEDEFVITRVFNAPRDLVFDAWTNAAHLVKWFGPKGFSLDVVSLDLRPGGTFFYCMRSPQGFEMWGKFVYREIVRPEMLSLVNSFSDAQGGFTRHPMSSTWPLESLSRNTFEKEGQSQTRFTLRSYPINATEEERKTFREGHASMQAGFGGTFDQLDEYLASL